MKAFNLAAIIMTTFGSLLAHAQGQLPPKTDDPKAKQPQEQKVTFTSNPGAQSQARAQNAGDLLKPKEKKITFITEKKAASREGGSNIGGSPDTIQVVTDWSSGVTKTLSDYFDAADFKKREGNFPLANSIFRSGLQDILEHANERLLERSTWTYKMAERTLALAERLEADHQDEAEFVVLTSLYRLIAKHAGLETQLTLYTKDLLDWFGKNMCFFKKDGGAYPSFNDRAFFITLASLAKGLREDFGSTTIGNAFGRLAEDAENVLAQNGSLSTNKIDAVTAAVRNLETIQKELK